MDVNEAAVLQIVLRTAAALLFLEAAIGKFADRSGFEGVVANYRVLPAPLVGPVARLLPPTEVLLAVGLLAGVLSPWPATAAAGLLLVFAAAMALNLRRGRAAIDCGCGRGGLRQPLSWSRVARNVVLAGLLVVTAPPKTAGLADWSLGLAGGGVLFLLDYTLAYLSSLAPRAAARGIPR
ncbi:MAG: methylamine utilization protein MauE [Phenylobacterium sp.]|uniref:MauE/DoxX family redox-associated membrane protein n=1 Tax=Phenylobacterium sp. TaxID=1871053 RepID=UPI00121B8E1E|nr:MauE/DoxX family redox-associated membrane protein [Phenylobacterium sp.]TAJ72466.1 MAG: methylamine utilization protein MauE [Phenylobacterium sp.]